MPDSAPHGQGLHLRLLGEIEVERDGTVLALPPSKKTRALLAYLAVIGRPQRRDRLCTMLWEIPDDPRGALRWSLSKLRALIDRPGKHVIADRDTVAFDTGGVRIDLFEIRAALADGIETACTERLIALAEAFRGEFLEGLDLPACHEFQAWCTAEREDARIARVRILDALVGRLDGDPERALPYARTLVRIEVADEAFRARLMSLLGRCGRRDEAERQYEIGRRLMAEMGVPAAGLMEAAWRALSAPAASRPAPVGRDASSGAMDHPDEPVPMIGRDAELARLCRELERAAGERRARVVLLSGEPGVGKTRLLAEFTTLARGRGATVLDGCAHEAETGEPYRPWIDALGRLATAAVGGAVGDELALLMPVFGEAASASVAGSSRERLFGAVVDLIAARAQSGPILVVLDDVHWCDDASAALLHYVVRMNRFRPILVVLAARDGELPDNPSMERVLRGLRHERLIDEIALAPLGPEHTLELVQRVMPGAMPDIDAETVFAESRGNPLFAIELTRAGPARRDGLPPTIGGLIRDRITRLPVPATLTLRWASVLGRSFSVRRLERLPDLDPGELVASLEVLERHALIRPVESGLSGDAYLFMHDLVRQAVYADISGPRRRLMHRRVVEMLRESAETDAAASTELVEHAALAGDFATAAGACVAAGRRFLRLFANIEAYAIARRGQHYATALGEPERLRLRLELTGIELGARRPEHPDEMARRLEELCEQAIDHGCPEHARLGFHMLGHLRWEGGAWSEARRDMLRAEMVSRSAEPGEHVVAMAEAARCLALLERDLGQAESLLLEASALAQRAGVESEAIVAANGMLRLYQGELDAAVALLEEARTRARNGGDRHAEFQALEHLVIAAMQRGAFVEAIRLTAELESLGNRLRDGSEAPFARALMALLCNAANRDTEGSRVASAAGPDAVPDDILDEALAALRAADSKYRLAFILTRAALADIVSGNPARAQRRAAEALDCALSLERPSEVVLARVALVRAASLLGDEVTARREARLLMEQTGGPLSAEARGAADAVLAEHGLVKRNGLRRTQRHAASDRRTPAR